MVMRWPGQISAGAVYRNPVSTLDLLPTAVVAAGGTVESSWGLDGVNLIPFLKNQEKYQPHKVLYWRKGSEGAIRRDSWKLIFQPGKLSALYDLSVDPGEKNDLSTKQRTRVAAMEVEWKQWESGMGRSQPTEPPKGFKAPWLKQAH